MDLDFATLLSILLLGLGIILIISAIQSVATYIGISLIVLSTGWLLVARLRNRKRPR